MAGVVVNSVACTFCHYSGWIWIHSGIGQFQPLWLLFSISSTPNTTALTNPLLPPHMVPPLVPLFMWPLWPVLSKRTPYSGCHGNDLGGPPVRHTLVHRHTRLHTAAKASDRYSIIRRVAWGGERRVALQWAHCRDTGEIRERECVCQWERQKVGVHASVYVCMSRRHCICHCTVVEQCQKVFVFVSLKGTCSKCSQDVAKWPLRPPNPYLSYYRAVYYV